MKGKLKVFYITILCLTACLIASGLFASVSRRKMVANAVGERTNDYSLWDSATNAILSVEKVQVQAGSGLTSTHDFTTPLYYNSNHETELEKMYSYNYDNGGRVPDEHTIENANAVYYKNIANGSNTKYVVGDGEFVMLDNRLGSNGYFNEKLGSAYNKEGESVNLQEAILVSLGGYFKNDFVEGKAGINGYTDANEIEVKPAHAGANLDAISVSAYHDGQQVSTPGVRTYANENGFNREDFVWVIPQTEGCEGLYDLNIRYRYNGSGPFYSMHFSFYILLGESYYGSLNDSMGNSYNAQPTLNISKGADGVRRFYLGENDFNNYPTLTYDVTKYEMSFIHTVSGVTKTYTFTNQQNAGRMFLNCVQTGYNQTLTTSYPLGEVGTKGNIAVVVFTEMGNYNIKYKYKYNDQTLDEMNLKLDDDQLAIHGFELKYAKAGYNEAQMRCLTFANNSSSGTEQMGVGVVLPNAYKKGEGVANQTELGAMFDYDLSSNNPVGSLVETEWANVEAKDAQEYLTEGNFNIDFAKTNQGSLWLDGVDEFESGESFYYFGTSLNTLKENIVGGRFNGFTNRTSFNQTGYYLVFIKVDAINKSYTQVFAFQYTADTVSIHTEKVNDDASATPIASGAYTNKNVKVWWEEPSIFEREITVKFIKSTPNVYPSWQELATAIDNQGTIIENGTILGEEVGRVDQNTGATFLIKLQSVGKSASYRTFIIDRENITDVQALAVESSINRLGNVIYTFVENSDGTPLKLLNSITNSFATLNWKDKNSGAKIWASYTRTPFVADSLAPNQVGGTSASEVWFSTKYKLGTTIGVLDLEKPNLNGELTSANVLFEQGIYLFTLTDEAGNSCRYMFVIDKTENYFKITDIEGNSIFETRANLLYTDQVNVEIGTHKTIELNKAETNSMNDELFEFIAAASNGNFDGLNYYSQTGTNSANLKNLFASIGNKYYLKVANSTFNVYNNQREPIQNQNVNFNLITRSYTVEALGSSNVRQFYSVGENQIVLNFPTDSNSYLIVEVNTDHSLGMAFYANNQQTLTNFNNLENTGLNGATRLYFDDDGTKTAIQAAHATGADYLAFAWNMGTEGKYEIKTVSMAFYQLDLTELDETASSEFLNNYFYTKKNLQKTLYDKDTGRADEVYVSSTENPRAVALLNITRNQTNAGLYVITREYVNELEEGDKDKQILTYYFIVDRNGIIALGEGQQKSINGGYISVGLKNNELLFNNFNVAGVPTGTIQLNNSAAATSYNIYLTTNRLPAVLNIPVGKYFYSGNLFNSGAKINNGQDYFGSEYYAGKLNFKLYFKDTQGQLNDNLNNRLLFSTEQKVNNGYYSLNIAENLTDNLKNYFVNAQNSAEFITLPGDYVLIITDNVEGGGHQKVIGLRVVKNNPTTNIYSARDSKADFSDRVANAVNYNLTTAEEFVVVDMQNLQNELVTIANISAELDLDYLFVSQTRGEVETTYINYNHEWLGGININDLSQNEVVEYSTQNGKTTNRKILLNTYLRDENGNIYDYETLSKKLSYSITVRFNITDGDDLEKYADSYYYVENGEIKPCYYTTYTVEIDRVPPMANTINLQAQDNLAQYYCSNNELFENAVVVEDDVAHFVRRYKDYYASNLQRANIYALHVNASTPFSGEDVARVYVRQIFADSASLTLPADLSNGYEERTLPSYFGEFSLTAGAYYEILEQDKAGNTTQYVVCYDGNANLQLNFKADVALNGRVEKGQTITFNAQNVEKPSLTLFEIFEEDAMITASTDMFYKFELYQGQELVGEIATNFTTNFSNEFATAFLNMLTAPGFGNYNLVIISNTNRAEYTINYLDANNIISLQVENLVVHEQDSWRIALDGANVTVDNITYYAQTITLQQGEVELTYTCQIEDGQFNYYCNGQRVENNLVTEIDGLPLSGSYRISMTDVFNKIYHYSFNTEGEQPSEINFGADGTTPYSTYMGVYYSFNQANISFDTVMYNNFSLSYSLLCKGNLTTGNINNAGDQLLENGTIVVSKENGRQQIVIKPYFADDLTGAVLTVQARLFNDLGDEIVYNVVIDSSTGAVLLKENANQGENKKYQIDINVFGEENLLNTKSPEIYTGTFYLSWVPVQNEWFDFDYAIFEQMQDGTLQTYDVNGVTNFVISTREESTGIYRFVVTIKNKAGEVLGNKVYTFTVQTAVNKNYSVRTEDGKVLAANSTFMFNDFSAFSAGYAGQLNPGVGVQNVNPFELTGSYPLYVYNEPMFVGIAEDSGAGIINWQVFSLEQGKQSYSFVVYRVYSLQNAYNFYFATLTVSKFDNFIKNLEIVDNSTEESTRITSPFLTQTNNRFYTLSQSYSLKGEQNLEVVNNNVLNIIGKNCVVISVWCNGAFVKDYACLNGGESFNYTILGSGQFTFVFKDLAGNVFNFNYDAILDGTTRVVEELNIVLLREVVLKANDMDAINNAYYNGQVEIKIYNPSMYSADARDIKLTYTLNGQPYSPEINQYTYTFKDYGTYKIVATAPVGEIELKKTIVFTIVNPNEARQSLDLSSIASYKISKVLNNRGENITAQFLNVLNARQDRNKYLISYEFLQQNSAALNVGSGKQKLTITYLVDDGIYPIREVEFAFTLNNQVPSIQCNVKPGDSTTKSFTITYTPGVIYDQVGDCELYINDILVCKIDENSKNTNVPQTFKVSFKEYGKGDYYVVLKGPSGAVHTSFKVTIKEPLNTWSIIVIVVVVGLVLLVVGTIIFLRKRMRIR